MNWFVMFSCNFIFSPYFVLHLVAITISQEAAEKANVKATEAYEKGLKKTNI